MSNLSEKLKSLGVKIRARDMIPVSKTHRHHDLESTLQGQYITNIQGDTFISDHTFSSIDVNKYDLNDVTKGLEIIASWTGYELLAGQSLDKFVFIDTETTGLAGGTGTFTFLIGAGKFENELFHLKQFFLHDPTEEPAQLFAFEEFIAGCTIVITFNGKSFDIPLLNTRFLTHGWRLPLHDFMHIDLLLLARRLWRERLPSRTLGNIEAQILDITRSLEDIPGWMIPQIYFDYLRLGEINSINKVFYHNSMDVLSLASLLNYILYIFINPTNAPTKQVEDYIALAKFFEDLGLHEHATKLYLHALSQNHTHSGYTDTLNRLALIYKRQENYPQAMQLWELAANSKSVLAHIELAKYYEHRIHDYEKAIYWTEAALNQVQSQINNKLEKKQWNDEIEHRLKRLIRLNS